MMKLCLFHILIISIYTLKAQEINRFDLSSDTEEQEYKEYQEWKSQLNINFHSKDEEDYRFKIFEQNNRKIKIHNAQKDATYQMGLNQFSYLSDEEFSSIYLINLSDFILEDTVHFATNNERKESSSDFILHKRHHKNRFQNKDTETQFLETTPASLDLRTQDGIGKIKDQGRCGSSWAFSSCAAIEYAHWKKMNQVADLSEQQLVDCVFAPYRSGCLGGWMPSAFLWVAKNGGIALENEYPYTGNYGNCRTSSSSGVRIKSDKPYVQLNDDDNTVKQALNTNGVLSVCVDASGWDSYRSGIFQSQNYARPQCSQAVALIGYGTENGIPYWLLRNSWSTWWGDGGYMKADARRSPYGRNYGGVILQFSFYPQVA